MIPPRMGSTGGVAMVAAYLLSSNFLMASSFSELPASEYHGLESVNEYSDLVRFDHLSAPFDARAYGRISIDVIEITPDSINVMWRLTNLTQSDTVVESTFLCDTFHGRIVSDKLSGNANSFRFRFLAASTRYVICVHLLEKSKTTNTSVLHYSCQPVTTIPVIRSDSVVAVVLTIGYFVLMVVMGCVSWYRRVRKSQKAEDEEKSAADKLSNADEDYIKFIKAAERAGLSYNPAEANKLGPFGDFNNDVYASSNNHGNCSGACVPFIAKEEEELVCYNAKRREISF